MTCHTKNTSENTEEFTRIQKMLQYENELWANNLTYVAGLDEVGRGPLAGPVVAAAVIFPKDAYIPFIDDSKKLPEKTREELYETILDKSLDHGIASADVDEIDRYNILQASFLAMQRAIDKMNTKPEFLLIDGKVYPKQNIPVKTIVKGDSLCFSIAAASIIAKVTRDRIMREYDKIYPGYGFESHKGYATKAHLNAIEQVGFCRIHRRSFHPKRFRGQLTLFENE